MIIMAKFTRSERMKNLKKFIKKNIYKLLCVVFIIIIGILIFQINNKKCIAETKIPFEKTNYVFLGDSITSGYKVNEYFSGQHVINSGIVGNKTEDVLKELETRVYKYNPTKIFLLIGINNLKSGEKVEKVINDIKKITDEIKNNRKYATIYIESIYPIADKKDKKDIEKIVPKCNNKTIKEANEKLKKLCKENNMIYIDIYSGLINKEGNLKADYTTDGLHLNDLGYFKVTKILEKYVIEQALEKN